MKVNFFLLAIALVIGGLLFYGFYSMESYLPVSALGSAVCTLFLVLTMGVSIPEYPRSTTMFRMLAGLLFAGLLVADLVLIMLKAPEALFIITNGLVVAGGSIGLYTIYKSEQ